MSVEAKSISQKVTAILIVVVVSVFFFGVLKIYME
jgi:hypothetical protein